MTLNYYTLVNETLLEIVEGNWKNYEECDIHQVMHIFNWSPKDKIISFSTIFDKNNLEIINDVCSFKWNTNKNKMVIEYDQDADDQDVEYTIFDFSEYKHKYEIGDHVPVFIENKCKLCIFEYSDEAKAKCNMFHIV